MIKAPLHMCGYSGCKRLTRERYCEEHTEQDKQRRQKQADYRRGSASERGYDRTWQKMRLWHLRQYPLCQECGAWDKLQVHHKVPINDGGARLDENNLITLCKRCHDKKHGRGKA